MKKLSKLPITLEVPRKVIFQLAWERVTKDVDLKKCTHGDVIVLAALAENLVDDLSAP